jgi:hypothetical protein
VTQRNVIPWAEMEKKLAVRLAAKAAAGELADDSDGDAPSSEPLVATDVIEAAPDSGVHSSVDEPPPTDLTYAVYTVKDLDARGPARSPRMSMAFAPELQAPPSRWAEVGKAAALLIRSWWIHVRMSKPRPPLHAVCQVPLQLFLTELKLSLRASPWRKIAIGGGVAIGTMLALVFVVVTAAELTDDLKPASRTSAMTTAKVGSLTSTATADYAANVAVAAKAPEPPKAVAAAGDTIEIDDAPPPPVSKPALKAPPVKKAPPKPVEIFIP